MKKKAGELKKGDKINIGGEILVIDSIEVSDISKQGTKKCRIIALRENQENIAIIRPLDYPFNTI